MPSRFGDSACRRQRTPSAACRAASPSNNVKKCTLEEVLTRLSRPSSRGSDVGIVTPKGVRCFGSSLPASPDVSGQGPRAMVRSHSSSSVSSLSSAVEQHVVAAQLRKSVDCALGDEAAVDGEEVDKVVADVLDSQARKQIDTIRYLEQMLVTLEPSLQDPQRHNKEEMQEKVRKIQDKMDDAIWLWARLDRETAKRRKSHARRKRHKAEREERRRWRDQEDDIVRRSSSGYVHGKERSWELFWLSVLDTCIYTLDFQRLLTALALYIVATAQAGWRNTMQICDSIAAVTERQCSRWGC